MKVREIVSGRVCQISSSAMLSEAAERMRALQVSALPVVENNQIVGVVTQRDVAAKSGSAEVDPRTTPVREAMTKQSAWCAQDDDVETAARIMEENGVQRLIVLGPDRKAVGVLSRGQLARGRSKIKLQT
jgi:CBS domain-containing protein